MYEYRSDDPVRREDNRKKIPKALYYALGGLVLLCLAVLSFPGNGSGFTQAYREFASRDPGDGRGDYPNEGGSGSKVSPDRPTDSTERPGPTGNAVTPRPHIQAQRVQVRTTPKPTVRPSKPAVASKAVAKSGFDLDLFARAVASHETSGCKKGYGVSHDNCHGVKKGRTYPCMTHGFRKMCDFKNKEESFVAFKIIWKKWYGEFPTKELANRYSGAKGYVECWDKRDGDLCSSWQNAVMSFYRNPSTLKI